MAGCTKDLHVFIYSGLIASYKPKPGERCICGEFSVEEMEAKGKSLHKLEKENARLRAALEKVEWDKDGYCLWCDGQERQHEPDCPRQQALGGAFTGGNP